MSAPLDPWSERPVDDTGGPIGWGVPSTLTVDDDRMPTVVLVASILTGLTSTLTLLLVALGGLVLGKAAAAILEAFDVEHAGAWVWGTLAGFAAMCVTSSVCAILVTRRSQVARWALLVLSALTIAVSAVLAFAIVVSVVNLVVAGAVIVLLTVSDAGRWFARSGPHGDLRAGDLVTDDI